MRRRLPVVPDEALFFQGRRYDSLAERERAAAAWCERRSRLLAQLGYDEDGWPL